MRMFPIAVVGVVGLGLSISASAQDVVSEPQSDRPPFAFMDVFELEWAVDPQISPDGDGVAYVRTSLGIMEDQKRSEIWTVTADGVDHRRVTEGSSPRWSPSGDRLAYVAEGQIHVRWMDTGDTATLTQLEEGPRGITWSPDGAWLAFNMLVPYPAPRLATMPRPPDGAEWAEMPIMEDRFWNKQDGVGYRPFGYDHIFIVPSEGGTVTQLTSGDYQHSAAAAWTPDGTALVFSANRNQDAEYEYRNSDLYEVSLAGHRIRQLTTRNGPEHSPAVSPDGRQIAYLGFEDRMRAYQLTQLHVMNRDGSGTRVVTTDLDRSVATPVWAVDSTEIYLQYHDEGNTKLARVSLDGDLQVLADSLGATTYGRPTGGASFTVAADGTFAFNRTRPEHPGEVALGTREGGTRHLTQLNSDLLSNRTLGEVEELWWESSHDGRAVQGWIVKPPNFDPTQQYPFILEIHGGPISNYGDRFSTEMQLYAASGYVVLYANPRGSTSYGEEFADLIYRNYPGQDYDDLMSGVDAVIDRGYVDTEQLFVTGGSAGGIMTTWIVGQTDRFRAAAAQKPVINWYSKLLTADNWFRYFGNRFEGLPWENPDNYLRFSPISLVGNVETPTLIVTGEADLRAPISESSQYFHALKLRRVDTALVRLPGAWHDMSRRPSQLIGKVANVLAWFERYRTKESATRE